MALTRPYGGYRANMSRSIAALTLRPQFGLFTTHQVVRLGRRPVIGCLQLHPYHVTLALINSRCGLRAEQFGWISSKCMNSAGIPAEAVEGPGKAQAPCQRTSLWQKRRALPCSVSGIGTLHC